MAEDPRLIYTCVAVESIRYYGYGHNGGCQFIIDQPYIVIKGSQMKGSIKVSGNFNIPVSKGRKIKYKQDYHTQMIPIEILKRVLVFKCKYPKTSKR